MVLLVPQLDVGGKRAAGGDDWCGYKQRLVSEGQAHVALVVEGDTPVGWCEYVTPTELPGIFHRKEAEARSQLPDYRLTCFFVDRSHRGKGVATAALEGALELIAQSGGGVVESYPRDIAGKKYSASFLVNVTRGMFERAGFTYVNTLGKNNCIMRKVVGPIPIHRAPTPGERTTSDFG